MTDELPRLSVIIVSTASLQEIPACLSKIRAQCRPVGGETILVYAADRDFLPVQETGSADLVLLRLPQQASLPQLLGAAVGHARGEVIAITDATCTVDERWVAAILTAHTASSPVIGGAVEPGRLTTLVEWAAYFYDYGRFMLPLPAGRFYLVPGINISMKRWALTKGRTFVEGEFWKSYWCRCLQAEGIPLAVVPTVVVFYQRSYTLYQLLVRWFHQGRCFAGMRLSQLSHAQRTIYLVGSLTLPFVFCWRLLRDVLPKRRRMGKFFLSFPIIILAAMSWAFGELVGYWAGTGTSCQHVR